MLGWERYKLRVTSYEGKVNKLCIFANSKVKDMKIVYFKKGLIAVTIVLVMVSCGSANAQTNRQRILDLQEDIDRTELIEKYVKVIGNGFSTCMPVFIISDLYTGYAIIGGDDLFSYYKKEYLDSNQAKKMSMKDYYTFAANLLLNKDTIKFVSKELPKFWGQKVSIVDSIVNYPYEKKQELIDLAFGDDALMKRETNSRNTLYQPASTILKLFEWGIFMMYWDDPPSYELYDYTQFDGRIGSEPADMINDCLIKFLAHINPQSDHNIHIMTDFYPRCFYFRDHEEELSGEKITYIAYKELINSQSDTTFSKLLENGISVIDYCGLFLENDLLTISFYKNIITQSEERGRLSSSQEVRGDFIYQYSPTKKKWYFIEAKYEE